MRLTQIQQILEIEKCTSISQAARNLFISQPALSAVLNELEAEIGVPLFNRTKTGVTVTEDGIRILASMKQMMKEVHYIENYTNQTEELTGTITIMMGSSYEFLFAELIQRFKKNFPKANLQILNRITPNVYMDIKKDLLDFSIMSIYSDTGRYLYPDEIPEDKTVSIRPLQKCHTCAVMHRMHPQSAASTLFLSDLASEQLILGRQYTAELFTKNLPLGKYPITNLERTTILELLDQNYGIFLDSTPFSLEYYQSLYPKYKVTPVLNNVMDDPGAEFEWPTYFCYKKHPNNRLQQQLVEEITELLQSYRLFQELPKKE